MLSGKFIIVVLVVIVLVVGYAVFPAFNTMFRTVNTTGLSVEMLGIVKLAPYFFFGVIGYAAYIVWKRGK